jgi:hypothetical protein
MYPYFGLKKVDVFAEVRAIDGSSTNVWIQVRKTLEGNGFAWKKDSEVDPTKAPQFFVHKEKTEQYVGVLMSDSTELQENKMYKPEGIIPKGNTAVLLYYFPY